MYVDNAATAFPTMFPVDNQRSWANPSSAHQHGREARAAFNEAKAAVLQTLGSPSSGTAFARLRRTRRPTP